MANSLLQYLMKMFGASDEMASSVGLKESLSLPPVWYAHNKIVGDCGMLPLNVYKKSGDSFGVDYRHPAYKLLRERPNRMQSPSMFKEQILSHALMYGNGRAAIIRDNSGNPIELLPMMPDRSVSVIYKGEKYHAIKSDVGYDKDDDLLADIPSNKDNWIVFSDDDVIHITGFSWNGVEGMGLLDIGQSTFASGNKSQKYIQNQISKGFRGKLFIEAPIGLFRDGEKAREFMDQFNASEAGADNAGKAAMLREGMKVTTVNASNTESQFVELMKFTRTDVGLLFGVEAMPGDSESVSYNGHEQKQLAYLVALDRWLVKIEEQCGMKLLTETQKIRGSHYFKFNRQAIYRTDLKTTTDSLVAFVNARIMNPNEAREKLDMNPYEGGEQYANPAITPGSSGEVEDDPDEGDGGESNSESNPESGSASNSLALEETARSLIKVEARNAIAGAKTKSFAKWIDNNYPKWEKKLADKLEAIGLDRDFASKHCSESVSQLVDVAKTTSKEGLELAVSNVVSAWESRVYSLIGRNKNE